MGVLLCGSRSSAAASSAFFSLIEVVEKNNEKPLVTFVPETSAAASSNLGSGAIYAGSKQIEQVDWNPPSPLSSRALILAAENRLAAASPAQLLDTAIIMVTPPNSDTIDFSHTAVSAMIDNYFKGTIFLIKELQNYFRAKKTGTLALILPEDPVSGITAAALKEALKTYIRGLLDKSQTEIFKTIVFSCAFNKLEQPSDFAAFVHKTISDPKKSDAGKWLKYNKMKLFMHQQKTRGRGE
jgi:hypothetical protein